MKKILLAVIVLGMLPVVCNAKEPRTGRDLTVAFVASTFNESTQKYSSKWPFKEPQAPKSIKLATNAGVVTTYTLKTDKEEYLFEILAKSGVVCHSTGGVMFGPGKKDYIKFPAVPGKELVRVEIVSGKDSSDPLSPVIVTEDGTPVAGGDAVSVPFSLNDGLVWNLEGAGKGVACKLVTNWTHYFGIRELKLTYR